MNREDIIRMAREAGFEELFKDSHDWVCFTEEIERFASLVAAAERNSWPAEMEAMERQVNILTDALAQAVAAERDRMCEQFNIPKELAHEKAKSNETD